MSACAASPPTGFISSTTMFVDCQAQILGSGAWHALASPGSTLTIAITSFLTISIALIGYNLLLGNVITVRSGTLTFVKIGAVFALGTSWPVYRTLVYDLIVDGPGQLVSEVGPAAGVRGSDGTLLERLDAADDALGQLAILGVGLPPPNADPRVPPPFGGFDAFALGGARILFEGTSIGGLAVVRIVAGLMLALGPFFIAFLMFDSTRGLFEGWLRVVSGSAVGALGVMVVLGLELGFLEPWLSDVVARRVAGEALPSASTQLFVITALFAAAIGFTIFACAWLTSAFRLSWAGRTAETPVKTEAAGRGTIDPPRNYPLAAREDRTRASDLAMLLQSASYRERTATVHASSSSETRTSGPLAGGAHQGPPGARTAVPIGRSFTRRTHARVSALAGKRDQRK